MKHNAIQLKETKSVHLKEATWKTIIQSVQTQQNVTLVLVEGLSAVATFLFPRQQQEASETHNSTAACFHIHRNPSR